MTLRIRDVIAIPPTKPRLVVNVSEINGEERKAFRAHEYVITDTVLEGMRRVVISMAESAGKGSPARVSGSAAPSAPVSLTSSLPPSWAWIWAACDPSLWLDRLESRGPGQHLPHPGPEQAQDKMPLYRWVGRLISLPEEAPDIEDPHVREGLREFIGGVEPYSYVVMGILHRHLAPSPS